MLQTHHCVWATFQAMLCKETPLVKPRMTPMAMQQRASTVLLQTPPCAWAMRHVMSIVMLPTPRVMIWAKPRVTSSVTMQAMPKPTTTQLANLQLVTLLARLQAASSATLKQSLDVTEQMTPLATLLTTRAKQLDKEFQHRRAMEFQHQLVMTQGPPLATPQATLQVTVLAMQQET